FTPGNYSISYATGTLTITPLAVTVSSGVAGTNKSYDGTTTATLAFSSPALSGAISGDVVSVNQSSAYSATFASPNAANNIGSTVTGLGLTGADAPDYTLTQPTGLTGNITPAALTVTASDVTGTYGSVSLNGSTGFSPSGLQNGETIGSVTLST